MLLDVRGRSGNDKRKKVLGGEGRKGLKGLKEGGIWKVASAPGKSERSDRSDVPHDWWIWLRETELFLIWHGRIVCEISDDSRDLKGSADGSTFRSMARWLDPRLHAFRPLLASWHIIPGIATTSESSLDLLKLPSGTLDMSTSKPRTSHRNVFGRGSGKWCVARSQSLGRASARNTTAACYS